jgi:hypothetical protein
MGTPKNYIGHDLDDIQKDIATKGYAEKDGNYIHNFYTLKGILESFCSDNGLQYTYSESKKVFIFRNIDPS